MHWTVLLADRAMPLDVSLRNMGHDPDGVGEGCRSCTCDCILGPGVVTQKKKLNRSPETAQETSGRELPGVRRAPGTATRGRGDPECSAAPAPALRRQVCRVRRERVAFLLR